MNDFMMPVQPGVAGELPPGIPQQPVGVVPPQVQAPVAQVPVAAPAGDYQQLMLDEGANGDTPHGMGFFDKIRSDPKMTQAMLMMGTRMMQGNKPGQDDMGMIGEAMMAGATAHNMLSWNEKQDAQKAKEFELKSKGENARIAGMEQETRQKAELFPNTKKKLELDLQNAQTDGERKKAEARIKEFEADPARMAEREGLETQRIQAQTTASNASAGASSAAAESSRATTSDKKRSAEMKEWAVSGTDEQKKQARDYFTVDDPAARATTVKQDQIRTLIKEANPQMTDQEVATATLEHMGTQKGERIIALKSIIDNGDDTARAAALEEMQGIVMKNKKGAAPAAAPAAGTGKGTWVLTPGKNPDLRSSYTWKAQ